MSMPKQTLSTSLVGLFDDIVNSDHEISTAKFCVTWLLQRQIKKFSHEKWRKTPVHPSRPHYRSAAHDT